MVGQDEGTSDNSNKQTKVTSDSSDEQDEVEREEVERDVVEEMNSEMADDFPVSDEEVRHESDSSLVLYDAQSLVGSDDDIGDDADADIDVDEDVEGYVPLPMSEEQVSDQCG